LLIGCGEDCGAPVLTHSQLAERIASLEAPAVVLLWAEWSRPAVELLPAIGELADEYEGRGVVLLAVCLGEPRGSGMKAALRRLPASVRQFSLAEEPPLTLSRYGLRDVPAALVYSPAGELLYTLESSEHALLTPADLADAIDSMLAGG